MLFQFSGQNAPVVPANMAVKQMPVKKFMIVCYRWVCYLPRIINNYEGMLVKRGIYAMFLVAGLLVAGCQSGEVMDYQDIQANIHKNVTTEQQIRVIYGEPLAVHVDSGAGTRTLVYRYDSNDHLKKAGVGVLGAVAGGVLGSQIGSGTGKEVATAVGAVAGAGLASSAVTTRSKVQTLKITVSLKTGRVIDYRFTGSESRTRSWRPSSGPGAL